MDSYETRATRAQQKIQKVLEEEQVAIMPFLQMIDATPQPVKPIIETKKPKIIT